MDVTDLDPAHQGFVFDLIGRHGFDPARFPLRLAPGDEQFFKSILPGYPGKPGAAFFRYVESTLRIFDVWNQLADQLGGVGGLDRVLDFGSGYGRLTRPLSQRLAPGRIWVSDIYREAVAWQREAFGVDGADSAADPAHFRLSGPFSIVFAGSVFSHLPDGLFQRWLARLYDLVDDGGLLAFSVHGAAFAPEGQAIGPDGIGYAGWSESDTLDPAIYGMTYVSDAYVRRAVAQACGEGAAAGLRVFPRSVYESQDLYVVPGRSCGLGGLQVAATPVAGFDSVGRSDRAWDGWALEPNPGARLERAELFVGGRAVAAMRPEAEHPHGGRFFPGAPNPVMRWSFDPVPLDRDAQVRVQLTSSTGKAAHAYALAPAAPGPGAPRV